MKRILTTIMALLLVAASAFGASATFTADTTTELATNTERGFYIATDTSGTDYCGGGAGGLSQILINNIAGANGPGQGVRTFRYEWLPTSGTSPLATDLACARQAGVKVIIFGSYCDVSSCNEGRSIAQVVSDIQAISSTLLTYRDVVMGVDFGMIGAFGEWAVSGATPPLDTGANKIKVRDAILAAVPPEIPVFLRDPPIAQVWYGPNPITSTHAYSGSDFSRLGFHNDCFMADPDDHSTYPGVVTVVDVNYTTSAANQRAYTAAHTNFAPFHAETCNAGTLRTKCFDTLQDNAGQAGGIMNEGPRYHLTSMNVGYDYTDFVANWKTAGGGNCYTQVLNLMGYRIAYDALVHPDTMTHGTSGNYVTLTLHNYGWARLHSPRQAQIRFKKTGATDIVCVFGEKLRNLPPQSSVSVPIRANCTIPSGQTTGVYNGFLEIPDVFSTAVNYMIRPANAAGSWDGTTGRYATGTNMTVN